MPVDAGAAAGPAEPLIKAPTPTFQRCFECMQVPVSPRPARAGAPSAGGHRSAKAARGCVTSACTPGPRFKAQPLTGLPAHYAVEFVLVAELSK